MGTVVTIVLGSLLAVGAAFGVVNAISSSSSSTQVTSPLVQYGSR
jgi:hypothetical protein